MLTVGGGAVVVAILVWRGYRSGGARATHLLGAMSEAAGTRIVCAEPERPLV